VSRPADSLRAAWTDLITSIPADPAIPAIAAREIGERLLSAYAEPHRHYHDQQHLTEVLGAVHRLVADPRDGRRGAAELADVRLAAWFHDVVYDPRAAPGRNEEDSAQLAEQLLTEIDLSPEVVERVARLVRDTATHEAADAASALLFDADLAILASGPERYAAYCAGVRAEYAHVPDADFRRGRAAILQGLLDHLRHRRA